MSNAIPSHARVVIVGGGIVGASTAYHLTKLGVADVVLLEQGKLTCGTTWHAAGLVGQLRATRNATRMSRYGIELYAALEGETGLSTGWKQCGSLNVAKTPDRLKLLKRQMARAKSFGIEFEFITPSEAGSIYPLLRTDDLCGAVWIPGDGKANPTDLTQSLAKGARMRGARIVEGARVTGLVVERGRVAGARYHTPDHQGEVRCETIVNCAGQWARELGALSGVNVPVFSAEHFYLVTRPIPGVHSNLPVMRDPDAERDPPHALPGDRAGENAAQRPGELYPRRQLHPRRGAGAARLFRVRRLQFGRHSQRRRCRQARRRMDRRRRSPDRPVGRRYPPLRAAACQPQTSVRSHRRDPGAALRDALAARRILDGASAAALTALRSIEGEGRGVRQQAQLGTRQLLSSACCDRAAAHARYPRLAAIRAGRAACLPRKRRRIRS